MKSETISRRQKIKVLNRMVSMKGKVQDINSEDCSSETAFYVTRLYRAIDLTIRQIASEIKDEKKL
jgi:hypothetical protein